MSKNNIVLPPPTRINHWPCKPTANVTSYARFDFSPGFLTSAPLSQIISEVAGTQKHQLSQLRHNLHFSRIIH